MRGGKISAAWTWRHAIARSTLSPTTRHVLLTLSIFMDEAGQSCYPSIEDLVEATGLSKRAVLTHLALACEDGWLSRKLHGYGGQKWKRLEYEAKWPGREVDTGDGREREQPKEGGERAAPPFEKAVNVGFEGGEGRAPKAVNHVHRGKEHSTHQSNNTPTLSQPSPPKIEREVSEDRSEEADRPRSWDFVVSDDPDGDPDFDDLVALWPVRDKLADAWSIWTGMQPADRAEARTYAPVLLADLRTKGRRTVFEALAKYLQGRAWRFGKPGASRQSTVEIKPFSRRFWAWVWARVAAGQRVGFSLSEALHGVSIWSRPGEVPSEEAELALVAVPVDGKGFTAWRDYLAARGSTLKRPDQVPVIWCPSEYPPVEAGKQNEVAA